MSKYSVALARNLSDANWDQEQFFDLLKKIMATMPYDLYIKEEKYGSSTESVGQNGSIGRTLTHIPTKLLSSTERLRAVWICG